MCVKISARCVSIDRVAANKVNMTTLSNTVTPVLLETPHTYTCLYTTD